MSELLRKFHKNFLLDVLDSSEVILQYRGRTRWAVRYDMVFEVEGDYWMVSYANGATEYQEDMEAFDCDMNDMVTATKVHAVPTITWRPIVLA